MAGLIAALLLAAGCASTAPVDRIQAFSQAFSQAFGSVNTLGQPLLDELAVAERAQGRRVAERRARGSTAAMEGPAPAASAPPATPPSATPNDCSRDQIPWQEVGRGGFIRGFCLPDVGYFSELGDPPATAQLRGGLGVVERYAQLLSLMASGAPADDAVAQVEALGQEVGGLLGSFGVATGPLAPALMALQPLLQAAARQAQVAETRRLILEGAPRVSDLIAALRAATPAMFNTLIAAPARQAALAEGPAAADATVQIEALRLTLANYVVLLGRLQQAWDATVIAAQAPPSPARLSELVAQASALRADAEAARKAWASLRAGRSAATATVR